MFLKVIELTLKYTAVALIVGYFTFTNSKKIERSINSLRFQLIESEKGFVQKEQALDIAITYEINGKNNLETYVKTYNQRFSVYSRSNGIMIGDPSYVFSNFTNGEKEMLCKPLYKPMYEAEQKQKNDKAQEKKKGLKGFFYSFYHALGGERK